MIDKIKRKIIRIYVDQETKSKVREIAKKHKLSESTWGRITILEKLQKEKMD